MTTATLRTVSPAQMAIRALLIEDWCAECQTTTDQELNTVALLAECVECGNDVEVSDHYARQMIAE